MCLFCKIVSREVPAKILFEDDELLAFSDIRPMAPTHALVIPKKHLVSLEDVGAGETELLGKLLLACQRVAREAGIVSSGYRVVTNTGPDAGQSVFHLHLHVLGGRAMAWPPG
jgi:histidine triad (HIT) family protein